MKVLFLSPHFPSQQKLFCSNLKKLGAIVIGIAEEWHHNIPNELWNGLNEYVKVKSMENFEEMRSVVNVLMERYGGDPQDWRIESHNEHWLELEAYLRGEFNIPGYKTKDIERVKPKSGMKQLFRLEGIPCARGKVMSTLEEAKDFVKEIGFPIVAKPDIGVGAQDTFKLHNTEELEHFFATKRTVPFIFEEFIDGDIESFDGLTDSLGNIVFFTSHKFSSGIMEVVAKDGELYYYSVQRVDPDMQDLGFRIIRAAGLKEKFFHIEFFRKRSDKQLVALEINLRAPGGFTTDMFNFANDIDVYNEWAQVIVEGKTTPVVYSRPYLCCFVGCKDHFEYAHTHAEVMTKCNGSIVMEGRMPEIFSKVMGNRFYVFRTRTLEDTQKKLSFILEKRQLECNHS